MKYLLSVLSTLFIINGCTTKEDFILFDDTNVSKPLAKKHTIKLKNTKPYEYRIRPHDRISITMYNHPELGTTSVQSQKVDNRGVLVNAKGYARFPLIKSIYLAGLTQTKAQQKIEKAYGKYLEDAEIYLEVLNKRAHILGEVKKPGLVPLVNEKMSLLQIIAEAGDLTDEANRKAIVILQNRNNKIHTQTVDLTSNAGINYANLMVYPGDIVYVTPNNMKPFNVGVKDISPIFGLAGQVLSPIANLKYLTD